MKDTEFTPEEKYSRPVALQTPFQAPAIDRTPTAPRGADAVGAGGVEASINWGDVLGTVAKVLF